MIDEILAYPAQIGDDVDAEFATARRSWSDPGPCEHRRAGVSARREQPFGFPSTTLAADETDTGRVAISASSTRSTIASPGIVRLPRSRVRARYVKRGAHAHPVTGVARHRSHANRARPVVILDVRVPRSDGGSDKRPLNWVEFLERMSPDRDRPIDAVPVIGEVGIGFEAAKERKYLGEAPARVSERCPAVVVHWRSPQGKASIRR